jgi:hypothetical protein
VEPDIVSLDALVEIEPQVEEQSIDFDLPQGIQEVTFKKLGANLLMDVGLPVEGLGLQAGMEFYTTANGSGEPAFTVPFPPLENFSLPASEQFIGIAGDTTIPPADYAGELSNIKSAKIKITANPQINDSNREIWVRGIGPESVIDVNATAAAVVEVDSAKINLNDFIPEENRSSSFPGEGDGFNFADLTGSLEDMVNLDSLEFEGINLYVYLSGLDDDPDVPDVQKLNIWDTRPGLNLTAVDRSEGAGEPTSITNNITNSLDPLDGFEPLVTGDRPLVFSEKDGDVVSGGLPDATFSTDKLTRILNSKPGNMYIKYDFKFGEPFPIKMSFLEGEEPIVKNIAVDIVLELPLKLRLLPLEEGADYGALRYISKETEDLLGREQGADDPFSDYTKYLDFASLEISYENTLGLYGAQLVLLDKNNPDNPDFAFVKELDPLQEQGTINITLRGNEIPNPFIPIVEVRVPLEPDKPYGLIEVKRGTEKPAGLKAISIRVKAQAYIDEEFTL